MSPGEPSEIRLALTLAPPMYLIKRARRPSCVHPRALECFASCSARCVAPPSRMLPMKCNLGAAQSLRDRRSASPVAAPGSARNGWPLRAGRGCRHQPGKATPEDFDEEGDALKIVLVDVGDLAVAPLAREAALPLIAPLGSHLEI